MMSPLKLTITFTALMLVSHFALAGRSLPELRGDLKRLDSSIQLTKAKISDAKDIQFLPDLYFMLAELTLEKSRMSYTIKRESRPNVPDSELDFTAEKRIQLEAIELYRSIEDRFANYPFLDKVRFTLAQEQARAGEVDAALKTFKRIIDANKDSSYVTKARIEVGNIFFEKKDYDFALENYKKVVNDPQAVGIEMAHYKMGWCYAFKGQFFDSLTSYNKSLSASLTAQKSAPSELNKEGKPESGKTFDLREDALIASVWPFSELSPEDLRANPKYRDPIAYFRSASYDKASFRRVLNKLAKRLTMKKRLLEARSVYLELFRLSDEFSEKMDSLEEFYNLTKQTKSEVYPQWLMTELRYVVVNLPPKKRASFEVLMRDFATSFHKTGQRTKRQDDLRLAYDAYKDYLSLYPKSKYAKSMRINLAEAAFHLGYQIEAGSLYLDAAKSKTGKPKKEFLSSSLEAFSKGFENSNEQSPLERLQGRYAFRMAVRDFVKQYPKDRAVANLKFNYAKSLYDENNYPDAAKYLMSFLKKHPNHTLATNSATLLLDTYYLRDDLKGLTKVSGEILSLPIASNLRDKIKSIATQAQLKRVQSIAGEFSSKAYAEKFLAFAKRAKSSELGETALLEAFLSLRSNNDPKAFDVGEDFVSQYKTSPKAQEILKSMAQLALVQIDYIRAANYLMAYSVSYKNDPASRDFASQAGQLYEQMGDYESAAEVQLQNGNYDEAAKLYAKSMSWARLETVSTKLGGVAGVYYQGLALYRSGKKSDGLSLLSRLGQMTANSTTDKKLLAHGLYIVAEDLEAQLSRSSETQTFSLSLLQKKVEAFKNLDAQLQAVMAQGDGEWTIASLYLLASANQKFAIFLKQAPAPTGFPPEKFKAMMASQIKNYLTASKQHFDNCRQMAEDNDVFTLYSTACQKKTTTVLKEKSVFKKFPLPKRFVSSTNPSLMGKLQKSPRDVGLLHELASELVRTGQYQHSIAVLQRALEVERQNANIEAEIGALYVYLGEYDLADAYLKKTLAQDPSHGHALRALAGLYKKFGFVNKLNATKSKLHGRKPTSLISYPGMRDL